MNKNNDEMGFILFMGVILIIVGASTYSCTSNYKEAQIGRLHRENEREKEYLEDCSKDTPKHECLYRWQSIGGMSEEQAH